MTTNDTEKVTDWSRAQLPELQKIVDESRTQPKALAQRCKIWFEALHGGPDAVRHIGIGMRGRLERARKFVNAAAKEMRSIYMRFEAEGLSVPPAIARCVSVDAALRATIGWCAQADAILRLDSVPYVNPKADLVYDFICDHPGQATIKTILRHLDSKGQLAEKRWLMNLIRELRERRGIVNRRGVGYFTELGFETWCLKNQLSPSED